MTETKYPDRKISEAFLAFADPLLHTEGISKRRFEEALRVAFTVWNAVVISEVRGDGYYLNQVRELSAGKPGMSALMESLIERKHELFGDDLRLIGEFKVTRTDDGFNVRAEARSPHPNPTTLPEPRRMRTPN